MVVFVWHPPLLGSVRLDVDDVTNPKVDEVRREFDQTLLCESEVSQRSQNKRPKLHTLEFPLEEIAGARPVTERVRHFKNLEGVSTTDISAT